MRRIVSIEFNTIPLSDAMAKKYNLSEIDLAVNLVNDVLSDFGYQVGYYFQILDPDYQNMKEIVSSIIGGQVTGIPASTAFNVLTYGKLIIVDFYL
ncbi:MAG: hypothetical protein ACRDA9_09960 [Plesiomonas shigelloides]